jgi:hypothetical protein
VVGQAGQPTAASTDAPSAEPDSGTEEDDDSGGQQNIQATSAPSNTPQPTNSPEPENTPTPNVPMATFLTGVNVRRGPSTLFNPPLGGYAANDTAEVLAVHPDRTWYKIRYYNADGWVHADLLTVSGNVANLPVDAGPPIPTLTPVPPTPVPVTPTPQLNVNIVAGNITTSPSTKVCNETFRIFVDVANFGANRSPGGSINVVDTSNGLETRTVGVFGEIDPGQTINVGPIPLTVSTNFEVEHVLTIVLDPNNAISETNENDNRGEHKYTLQKGDC